MHFLTFSAVRSRRGDGPIGGGEEPMLRRSAYCGLVCGVLFAGAAAAPASAQAVGTAEESGAIVAAPDPCTAPADLPPPTRAGPVDAQGRPVVSADVPTTATTTFGDVPVAIVTDLGAQAAGNGRADPRFET